MKQQTRSLPALMGLMMGSGRQRQSQDTADTAACKATTCAMGEPVPGDAQKPDGSGAFWEGGGTRPGGQTS